MMGASTPAFQPLGVALAADEAEQFDTVFKFKFLPALKNIPSLERIFRDHPEVEAQFRARARAAFEKGGANALLEQSGAIGATVLADAFMTYMPRARGQDLMLFVTAMYGILSTMNETDPEACILYQFGPKLGKPLENSRMLASVGRDRQLKLLDAMNAVVVNAADKPVPFDEAKGGEAFVALALRAAPLLTGKSSEVAEGTRLPADVAEAKVACSFGMKLFKDLMEMDAATSELAMRKMFAME